jgi:hypothetical protein
MKVKINTMVLILVLFLMASLVSMYGITRNLIEINKDYDDRYSELEMYYDECGVKVIDYARAWTISKTKLERCEQDLELAREPKYCVHPPGATINMGAGYEAGNVPVR